MNYLQGIIVIFLLCGSNAVAQTSLDVEKFTTKDGLSSNVIYRAHKDRQGFLWLATKDGLNRFDGTDFKVFRYDPTDTLSICGNTVYYVAEDPQSNLWVMTSNGLCKYLRSKNHFIRFRFPWIDKVEKQYSTEPSLMVINNQVWFTDYEGVNVMDAQTHKVQRYRLQEPYLGRHLISLGIDPMNRIYAGSSEGLFVLNTSKGVFEKSTLPLPTAAPFSYYIDSRKTFWITMWAQGALNLQGVPVRTYKYGQNETLLRIFETAPDSFIACGDYQGLLTFSRNDSALKPVKIYNKATGLEERFMIYSIASYDKDYVWMCGTEGLLKWDRRPRHIQKVVLDSALLQPPLKINALMNDPLNANEIWVNVWYQNLLKFDLKTGRATYFFAKDKTPLSSLPWGYYNALFSDSDGSVWVTGQYGVWVYDRNKNDFMKVSRSQTTEDLLNQSCYRIIKLRNGNYLTNVMGRGFVEFSRDLKYYQEYLFDFKELHSRDMAIGSVVESDEQTILFCSVRAGLFSLNRTTGRFSRITEDRYGSELPSNMTVMEKDFYGNIWIGTPEHIMVMDTSLSVIQKLSTQNGLVSNHVQYLFRDSRKNMWVSTRNGLSFLDSGSTVFKSLTQDDGLTQNDSYTITELHSGDIAVTHFNGISILNRSVTASRASTSPLLFTEIKVQDKELTPSANASLILSSGESPLMVRFAVVDVNTAGNVTYSYKLEGASGNWIPLGSSNFVSLYELQPGAYKLLVRVSNVSDITDSKPIELNIKVLPPFYATWWFRLLLLSMAGVLIYLYYRSRIQRQRALEDIRARISRDLHDDIGSTLSSINMLTRTANRRLQENDGKGLSESLVKIGDRTVRLLDNMNDIIWSVKPENDSLENVLSRMREYASTTLESRRIAFEIKFPSSTREEALSLDVKNSLYMIFKEAINNCVKYSECTQVSISLEYRNSHLDLLITDNGIGFDPEKAAPPGLFGGNGLHNMRKRAEEVGGQIEIISHPGTGTRVRFRK